MVVKVRVKGSILYRNIGETIYVTRKKRGITQDDLAEDTGLDRTYLSQIENGRRNPSVTSALKISKALKIDIKKLIDDKPTSKKRKQKKKSLRIKGKARR